MELALSTRWNAYRSKSGEEMIDEILAVGFKRVELGYDLRIDHVPGVRARLADGSIQVGIAAPASLSAKESASHGQESFRSRIRLASVHRVW